MRREWLNQIKQVGEITYGSFDPLYKQLFFTLLKVRSFVSIRKFLPMV
jgi:hypothetical protein